MGRVARMSIGDGSPTATAVGRISPHGARDDLARHTVQGPAPLSFAQERLWFFEQLVPGNSAYIMCRALRLRGSLDVEVLERSLTTISGRHEILRTTYMSAHGGPLQVVHSAKRLHLAITDLSYLPPSERDAALATCLATEARRPFDLTVDALLRGVLVRLGAADHVLMLCIHHIAFDAWSANI